MKKQLLAAQLLAKSLMPSVTNEAPLNKLIANVTNAGSGKMKLQITCLICKQPKEIEVPKDGYDLWLEGLAYIQEAMPLVPKEDRELLISKTCSKCFDELCGDEDL